MSLVNEWSIRFGPASPTLEETALECKLPLLSVLFERDVLGLDVGDVGVGVKCIADNDDVCLISYGVLDDSFRRGLCVYRYDGSKQAIRFLWSWRCPTERTEQVIVYNRAVEITLLKNLFAGLSLRSMFAMNIANRDRIFFSGILLQ